MEVLESLIGAYCVRSVVVQTTTGLFCVEIWARKLRDKDSVYGCRTMDGMVFNSRTEAQSRAKYLFARIVSVTEAGEPRFAFG